MGESDEGFGEGFGDGDRGDEGGFCTEQFLDGAGGGGTDGGDAERWRKGGVGEAKVEGLDGVGAGEDEPVEGVEAGEGGVEWGEVGGRGDLDGGDEDGVAAEVAEGVGEGGGLVGGAGDEDAGTHGFPAIFSLVRWDGRACLLTLKFFHTEDERKWSGARKQKTQPSGFAEVGCAAVPLSNSWRLSSPDGKNEVGLEFCCFGEFHTRGTTIAGGSKDLTVEAEKILQGRNIFLLDEARIGGRLLLNRVTFKIFSTGEVLIRELQVCEACLYLREDTVCGTGTCSIFVEEFDEVDGFVGIGESWVGLFVAKESVGRRNIGSAALDRTFVGSKGIGAISGLDADLSFGDWVNIGAEGLVALPK